MVGNGRMLLFETCTPDKQLFLYKNRTMGLKVAILPNLIEQFDDNTLEGPEL